jgi:hypothetical protein
MIIKPKNWVEFQHYKDRCPPWIKLHKSILDNYEFHLMQDASKSLALCLWLIASEHLEGEIDASLIKLAFRLREDEGKIEKALNELIEKGFFLMVQDASNTLAECKQVAPLEEKRKEEKRIDKGEEERSGNKLPDGFTKFWDTWPASSRKGAKSKCQKIWESKHLSAKTDEILAHVNFMRNEWKDPQFIPAPLTYLNQQRWDGAETRGAFQAGTSGSELGHYV